MRRGEFRVFTTRDGLTRNSILSLLEAGDGNVWIGTRKGLCRLRDGRITEPWTEKGLADAAIRTLLVDRGGVLWAGTDSGLYRFTGEQVEHFTTGDGLPGIFVYTVYQDADGVLWIGTRGGLARMADGSFTAYTTHEGMFDNVVVNTLEDDEGRLWMSCNKGIFTVDKMELAELAAGRRRSVRSVAFGKAEGTKSRECNAGGQPAGWKTSDRRLWFPTTKGVAIIDPRESRDVSAHDPACRRGALRGQTPGWELLLPRCGGAVEHLGETDGERLGAQANPLLRSGFGGWRQVSHARTELRRAARQHKAMRRGHVFEGAHWHTSRRTGRRLHGSPRRS